MPRRAWPACPSSGLLSGAGDGCGASALLIGLLLGAGYFLAKPPAYQATSQAFLTLGPNEDLTTAINTDVALAESRPVAALALQQAGATMKTSARSSDSYTAAPVTNRVHPHHRHRALQRRSGTRRD